MYFLLLFEFFPLALADGFSLEFEWQQTSLISRTLLSSLTDFDNAVIWVVSTHPLISKSSSPRTNPLLTVRRAPITIVITITFMFHSFFLIPWQVPGTYLSFRFRSILLFGQPVQQRPHFGMFSFSYWLSLGLVVWPRLGNLFLSQNPRGVWASFSPGQILDCAYTISLYGQI